MDTATALTGGQHGTKWIGVVLGVASAVSQIDPALIPPNLLPYFGYIAAAGVLARGFINTKNASQK